MALTRTNIGTNEDGTPRYHYHCDGAVLITGPATGQVTLADGTVYDVTPEVIEVQSPEHAAEAASIIEKG